MSTIGGSVMKRWLGCVGSGVVVAGLLVGAPPAVAADEASAPEPAVATTSVPAAPAEGDDVVAELAPRTTDEFALVGVTWDPGYDADGLVVEARSRLADGGWTGWEELHVDTESAEGGRPGTEPWWVDDADGVAVRVTSPSGERPPGLAVSTIASTETSQDDAVASAESAQASTLAADDYTAKPTIISRSSWGARKNTYCDSPRTATETRGITVHHTAGSNGYSKSQSASIVRAVQAFHMDGRDWCDIGYNFLVDKYGQIFEGRNGGQDVPVRGAHAGDAKVNLYTMGVSMMGTFSSSEPSADLKEAMVRLIGWRLGTTYHPATGSYAIGSKSYQRIIGHRDVVGTECPGAAAYRWISRDDGLRDRVAEYISGYASAAKTRVKQMGWSATGPVYVGEYPFGQDGGGRKVRLLKGDVYSSAEGGVQWVGASIRTEYTAIRSQASGLGVPTSGLRTTNHSAVHVQEFNHGSIWRVKRSGGYSSYAVWGPLDAEYRRLGGPKSSLGSPTKRYASLGGGVYRAYFWKGTITRKADGSFVVVTK